jgi:outer membrane protein OmpA-like peptidoglycan-associated protein
MNVKWIIALAGFLALGLAGIHYDVFANLPGGAGIHSIETNLQSHARRAMQSANVGWAKIEVHGQKAFLSGTAPSEIAREKARMIVLHSTGKGGAVMGAITSVNTDQIKILEKKEPDIWQAQKLPNGQWTIAGSIVDTKSRQALIDFITQADQASPDNIQDQMQLTSSLPRDWDQRAQMLLEALSQLDAGTVRMRGNRLSLQGSTDNAQIKTKVEDRFKQFTPPSHATTSVVLTTPPPPAPKPSDPYGRAGCQQLFAQTLGKDNIHFATSKAIITPNSYALMDNLAELATKCAKHPLIISGHTDHLGDPAFNNWLSLQRALAVKKYFVNKNIDGSYLSARGAGSAEPLCNENTRSCRQRNRRIEITIE